MNVHSVTSETGMQIFVGIIIIGPSPGTTRVFAMVSYLAFVSRPGNQCSGGTKEPEMVGPTDNGNNNRKPTMLG